MEEIENLNVNNTQWIKKKEETHLQVFLFCIKNIVTYYDDGTFTYMYISKRRWWIALRN